MIRTEMVIGGYRNRRQQPVSSSSRAVVQLLTEVTAGVVEIEQPFALLDIV